VLDPPSAAPAPRLRTPRTGIARALTEPWVWVVAAAIALGVTLLLKVTAPPPVHEVIQAPVQAAAPAAPAPQPPVRLSSLAAIDPLPRSFDPDVAAPGSYEVMRVEALESYRAAAYDSAAARFRDVIETRREIDEVRLYLGSTELLRGYPSAALPLLESVTIRSHDRELVAEALWQLANAWLLMEDREGALEALRRLQDLRSRRAAHADSLRDRLEKVAAVSE
jgi:hypothetical protein